MEGSEFGSNGTESLDPSLLVTTDRAGDGGVMVWGTILWYILGQADANQSWFKCRSMPSLVAERVHPFMAPNLVVKQQQLTVW